MTRESQATAPAVATEAPPWEAREYRFGGYAIYEGERCVAIVSSLEDEEEVARRIQVAVNAHEGLLTALDQVRRGLAFMDGVAEARLRSIADEAVSRAREEAA